MFSFNFNIGEGEKKKDITQDYVDDTHVPAEEYFPPSTVHCEAFEV